MKKLLVLMLVLGLAGLANAMILEISVNGDLDPKDSEIFLMPSETAILNIHTPDGYVIGDDVYFAIVVDVAYGTVGYDDELGTVLADHYDTAIYGAGAQDAGMCSPPEDGVWGVIANYGTSGNFGPGVIIDDILFHCEKEGDAVINLYSTPDFATFTLEDFVIIHQIPEPMTIALLSLGGLFLRRRK